MGKRMICKLRDDYEQKLGARYSLQRFQDDVIKLGFIPLLLVRQKLLGSAGSAP